MIHEIYGTLHRLLKAIIKRKTTRATFRMVSVSEDNLSENGSLLFESDDVGIIFNDFDTSKGLSKSQVYPIENIVPYNTCISYADSFRRVRHCSERQLGVAYEEAEDLWLSFITRSVIPGGYRNEGLHYAGYILDDESWCLPSWLWTNAAIVRMLCSIGQYERASALCDSIISRQLDCGGWIVRNDYDGMGAIPVLAPNDSAYIANNCCLEVYLSTNRREYLDASIKCAEWIIESSREDGTVYVGYSIRDDAWLTNYNIVDIGFTAGLFARLFQITGEMRYKDYLKHFTDRYIELFYLPTLNGFATSLDSANNQRGGIFGRGQAWALEGLIPAYDVLRDDNVRRVIEETILMLVRCQNKDGGWAYNLARPLMGVDCKATTLIALSLLNWSINKETMNAAKRALDWAIQHTSPDGSSSGGIFSYTTEGAIVHSMYTWTAFVYSSAYAVELKRRIEGTSR